MHSQSGHHGGSTSQATTPEATPAASRTRRARRITGGSLPPCEHPAFPLHRHKSGQWAAKIKGNRRYFGSWTEGPTGEAAWKRFSQEKPFWEAGQDPRQLTRQMGLVNNPLTWDEIAALWLDHRYGLIASADPDIRIDPRTFDDSKYAVRALKKWANLNEDPLLYPPSRWAKLREDLGRGVSPSTKGSRIGAIRDMLEWAVAAKKLVKLPDWGESFPPVSLGTKEEYRYDFQKEHGDRVFDLATVRTILARVDNAVEDAGLNKNNTSGYRGVSKKGPGCYEAYIVRRRNKGPGGTPVKEKVHLGEFKTAGEAADAYGRAAELNGINVARRMEVGTRLFRAATYLAANTGCYSKDIAGLTYDDVDLESHKPWGYIDTKRSKTAILWEAALWPETVARIKDYLKHRPEPDRTHRQYDQSWERLVFLSSTGQPVNVDEMKFDKAGKYRHTNRKDILKAACRKMLTDLGIKDKGVSFGAWRATFETLASGAIGVSRDSVKRLDAMNRTTARKIPGARNRYVHLPFDDLRPITEAVRERLFPEVVAAERLERQSSEEQAAARASKPGGAGPAMKLVS